MTVKTFIANPNGVSIEKDAIIYGEYTPLGRLQYVQLATSPNLASYISTDGASRPGEVRWVINTTAPVQGPSWVNFSIQNYAPGPFVNNIVQLSTVFVSMEPGPSGCVLDTTYMPNP